ncbi:MAG: histidine phosphatase family protein [Anaerolineae bacterium]|nr:histidine phosphatase family protein [Anaerolineae bacterium]
MATRITLIRHGETAWNVNGRWQGHAAVPLNDQGRDQAARLGEKLRPIADEIAAIYASDSLRTRQTANIIAARINRQVIPDPRLREIDLGEWQGLTVEEVRQWDGERLAHVQADSFNIPRPGGESFSVVADRALNALHEIVEQHKDQHVLVVSHGGTIRSILIKLELAKTATSPIGNTSLTVLLHGPNGGTEAIWKLDVFNLMDHLGTLRVSGQEG